MFRGLRSRLTEIIGGATTAVIVAPFMKEPELRGLLNAPPEACDLRVYTRWRAEEVARGVSDLEVYDLLRTRNVQLNLVDCLHAKYFRGDSRVLVGSANLTRAGLGYPSGNLELLVEQQFGPEFAAFEQQLANLAYPATREFRDELEVAAGAIAADWREPAERSEVLGWLPRTREPSDLWKAYNNEYDRLSRAAQESAQFDLEFLDLPRGLEKSAYESLVRTRLYGVELIRQIDVFAERSRRFGEMRDFLAQQSSAMELEVDPSRSWQTLFGWLLYFMPNRYKAWKANYSEIFQRRLQDD